MIDQSIKFDGQYPQTVPSEVGGTAINCHLVIVYKMNGTGIFGFNVLEGLGIYKLFSTNVTLRQNSNLMQKNITDMKTSSYASF